MKLLLTVLLLSVNSHALSNSVAAEDKGWQSNVHLSIPSFDDTNDKVTGYCNGTLIDASTLISAAHCFVRSEVLTGKKFMVEVGEYRYIDKNGVKVKIGYKHMIHHETSAKLRFLAGVNPNGTGTVPPELDIVVVKLDAPLSLPADFVFAPLWNTTLPQLNAATSKLTIVSINVMETITHMDTKQMAVLNKISQGRINIESTSTSRVAPGDSGAPVFAIINGKTYLIGVVKGTVQTFGSVRDIFVTLQGRLNLN